MERSALWIVSCAVALFGIPAAFVVLPHYVSAQEATTTEPASVDDLMLSETVGNPNATTHFAVTPVVSNEKAKPRDIIKKELLVTNNLDERLDLYITVENIDPTSGSQAAVEPGAADLSISLANWIEITRGVIELSPGESRKIPYLIHVNLAAKPGSYFARIVFGEGSRRAEAEAKKPEDGTSLMLNVEVLDDAKERLQLGTFKTSDSVVTGTDVSFSYLLENIGNREIEPRGSIRIFNRKGEEVGSVPLNAQGEVITPEDKKQLAAVWSAAGRFGKYKAFLDLEYGENQLASVQDTVYFWVFPWKEVMFALMGVGLLAVVGTLVLHMRAVARPVHHAIAHDPVPVASEPAVRERPSLEQTLGQISPMPLRPQSGSGGAVVLSARGRTVASTAGASFARSEPSMRAPHHAAPQVQGDTIELKPRRR